MANLGYIGLGTMGGRMAERLIARGHTVTGYNRTKARAQRLIDRGMRWADTPRAVVEQSDLVFAMVTDSRALEAIAYGPDGVVAAMQAGKVLIDMSTVGPAASRALAAAIHDRRGEMVDCPVSGSVITLEQGQLTMMVGGERATYDRVLPVLLDIGPKATYVGAHGTAVSMKIALNLSIGVQLLAYAEGILLAEKSGIDRATAVDVFAHSALASPMLQYRSTFVLELPDPAWFSVAMMQKDTTLALELGRELGVPLPTAAIANECLTAARGLGLEEKDCAAVFHVLARLAGVQP
jgi:3-hydroxyisobutyrate dehydrogenase-like beta-hydroxyacid dehydrogenase